MYSSQSTCVEVDSSGIKLSSIPFHSNTWIEVDTHSSKQGLKEINKIETKQQKSKSNRKLKAIEYTIFEDKFQISEYTTFKKSELLVSYSNFPFEKWISWQSLQSSLK